MKRLAILVGAAAIAAASIRAREADSNFYLPAKKSERPVESVKSDKSVKTDSTKKTLPAQPAKDLHDRIISPKTTFDPPLDPFGVARSFQHRWDFSTFLISAEEELKFRLDAARSRTLRMARAFSSLSAEAEARQRNLNTAALAAYLLSRDQHSWTPIEGRNLTEGQMLAVRATMQQDIKAMQTTLVDYETLRNSLNASAEEIAVLETDGLSGLRKRDSNTLNRPTVSTALLAKQNTESVLEERVFSVEALKATLAAEVLSNSGDRRQSIASFAPPPPPTATVSLPRGSDTKLPNAPSEAVMKGQPRGESLKQPEKTALVFETEINAPVHAVQKGVVAYAGVFRGYGQMIIIEHEKGLFSIYSHLGAIEVRQRQSIEVGTVLGRAGSPPEIGRSGVHFQVRKGKIALRPEDWLGAGQVQRLLVRK